MSLAVFHSAASYTSALRKMGRDRRREKIVNGRCFSFKVTPTSSATKATTGPFSLSLSFLEFNYDNAKSSGPTASCARTHHLFL